MKTLPLPVFALLTTLTFSPPALAENVTGRVYPGEVLLVQKAIEIPPKEVAGSQLINQYCTKCHSESRIMNALQSIHSSRGENYEKEVKSIISRKIRLTNGDISRQDGKRIIEYLVTAWNNQISGKETASQ